MADIYSFKNTNLIASQCYKASILKFSKALPDLASAYFSNFIPYHSFFIICIVQPYWLSFKFSHVSGSFSSQSLCKWSCIAWNAHLILYLSTLNIFFAWHPAYPQDIVKNSVFHLADAWITNVFQGLSLLLEFKLLEEKQLYIYLSWADCLRPNSCNGNKIFLK